MKNFENLIKKVEDNGNEIYWDEKASDSEIEKLQKEMKVSLPNSYIDFLKTYGCGGIVGEDISGIEDNNGLSTGGSTTLGNTLRASEDFDLPNGLVVIYYHDDEVCWCLDTRSEVNGECKVVNYDLFNRKIDEVIAENFESFFEEYLTVRAE
ncbi:SMI1/KNR4 family protein [Pokkaliibacter sp. CJK22405]|uniref:SMI1/KNR4 family protein n=1 Tax=Pokkaliibacter sp. CJK22405 TaxID=3384615 RepID=UPI003984ACD6